VASAKKYKYNTKYNTNTYNTKYTPPSGVFSFPEAIIATRTTHGTSHIHFSHAVMTKVERQKMTNDNGQRHAEMTTTR
jgi:hypothetical protein